MRNTVLVSVFIMLQICAVSFSGAGSNLIVWVVAIIAINAMAVAIILAAQFTLVDRLLGGENYRRDLHRYFAQLAFVASLLHWITSRESGEAVLSAFSEGAAELGEAVIWGMIALIACSVVKITPYKWWKRSHILMVPLYLFALLHSLFSPHSIAFGSPAGLAMLALGALAMLSFLYGCYAKRQVLASVTITDVVRHGTWFEVRATRPAGLRWQAGQHAQISVALPGLQERHPFTIASSAGDQQLCFIINCAGDDTQQMYRDLRPGHSLVIHRIQGSFIPRTTESRTQQFWLAGGSGITPFLAALKTMKADRGKAIKLVYAPGHLGEMMVSVLEQYRQVLPQLELYILAPGERLTESHLVASSRERSELYMCGPPALMHAAKGIWGRLDATVTGKVHREAFDARLALDINKLVPPVFARLALSQQYRLSKFSQRLRRVKEYL